MKRIKPPEPWFVRKDRHGVDIWRLAFFLGTDKVTGKKNMRVRNVRGTREEARVASALIAAALEQELNARPEDAVTLAARLGTAKEWVSPAELQVVIADGALVAGAVIGGKPALVMTFVKDDHPFPPVVLTGRSADSFLDSAARALASARGRRRVPARPERAHG